MTWPMSGPSRIMNHDEALDVVRPPSLGLGSAYLGGKLSITPGASARFTLAANVQPLGGKDLQLLPEGDRFADQLWVWTNVVNPGLQINDQVTRRGRVYQVQSAEEWGTYIRARLVAVDQLEDAP